MNSENVYSALFTLLKAVPGFVTYERKWQMVEDVDPNLMPYLGIKERDRVVFARTSDGVDAWLLTVDVIIYVNQGDQTAPSSPIFNPLIDAVCNALSPSTVALPETLAGVQFAPSIPVKERIMFFEGWLQGKSVVHIPIQILVSDDA